MSCWRGRPICTALASRGGSRTSYDKVPFQMKPQLLVGSASVCLQHSQPPQSHHNKVIIMLVILSPAKRLDFAQPTPALRHTQPDFQGETKKLINVLQGYSPRRLSNLMGISSDLAKLNHARYASWESPFTPDNAKPALLVFKGDVYIGLDAESYTKTDLNWAQKHLRILSGLHGVLRPLDLMQPYRLEMGTALPNPRGKNLYEFWGDRVTDTLNEALATQRSKILVNLASKEYFGVVQPKRLSGKLINVTFKDRKNDKYKIISFFAKKARGLMASHIVQNRVTNLQGLTEFASDGYYYVPEQSSKHDLVFYRD